MPGLRTVIVLYGLVSALAAHAATPVEVVLADPFDDPRGYCFDTVGFKHRAQPERGLQAHSCYSYQGVPAVDQAFDAGLIAGGTFRLIAFDRCMSARAMSAGSMLALEPCDGRDAQRFGHRIDGTIRPSAAPGLCVTAGAVSREGGGGDPVHRIRVLALEPCGSGRDGRQHWRQRESGE